MDAKGREVYLREAIRFKQSTLVAAKTGIVADKTVTNFFSMLPKSFFKYRRFDKYTSEMIEEQYLYLAPADTLDDPCECLFDFDLSELFDDKGAMTSFCYQTIVEAVISFVPEGQKEKAREYAYSCVNPDYTFNRRKAIEIFQQHPEELRGIDAVKLINALSECSDLSNSPQLDQSFSKLLCIARDAQKEIGVCSLTENPKSQVMWAMYGGTYEGYCVEYDFANDVEAAINTFPVIYEDARTNNVTTVLMQLFLSGLVEQLSNGKLETDQTQYFRLLLTKNEEWAFQDEWRVLDAANTKVAAPPIKAIYIGHKASQRNVDLILDLAKKHGFDVYRTKINPKTLEVDFENIDLSRVESEPFLQQPLDSLDYVFSLILSHWDRFQKCTLDDLFLNHTLKAKLVAEGLDNFKTLVTTSSTALFNIYHLDNQEARKLKKCAVALFEREMLPPNGMDVLLKDFRDNDYPELDQPIENDVTLRAAHALRRSGIITYRDLSHRTTKQLATIRNLGRKSLRSIETAVSEFYVKNRGGRNNDSSAESNNYRKPPFTKKDEFIARLSEIPTSSAPDASGENEFEFMRAKAIEAILDCAKAVLSPRDYDIFIGRHFPLRGKALEELGRRWGITRERIRQLDNKAVKKIRNLIRNGSSANQQYCDRFFEALCAVDLPQLAGFIRYIDSFEDVDSLIVRSIIGRKKNIKVLPSPEPPLATIPTKSTPVPEKKVQERQTKSKSLDLTDEKLLKTIYLACYEFATRYEGYNGSLYPAAIRSLVAGSKRSYVAGFAQDYTFYGCLPHISVAQVRKVMQCKTYQTCMQRRYSKKVQEFYLFDPYSHAAVLLKRQFEGME